MKSSREYVDKSILKRWPDSTWTWFRTYLKIWSDKDPDMGTIDNIHFSWMATTEWMLAEGIEVAGSGSQYNLYCVPNIKLYIFPTNFMKNLIGRNYSVESFFLFRQISYRWSAYVYWINPFKKIVWMTRLEIAEIWYSKDRC